MEKIFLELEYKGENLKGYLIKEDEQHITLKISSGYNMNLLKSKIKELDRQEINDNKGLKHKKLEFDKNKKTIKIIHTGGTIASKVDYSTGAVISKFTPEELLSLYPDLPELCNIEAVMIGNMFSGDINFNHHNVILEEIEKSINEDIDGIILSHGTDTIQYTAPGLQYSIENLPIPLIIVGAQRSSDRPSSDSYSNLKAAINFILDTIKSDKSYRRVGVCMHNSISDEDFFILDSINVRKMHTTRRDAFKQINYNPFALIKKNFEVEILRKDLLSNKPEKKFKVSKFDPKIKIGFFKSHPNMFVEEIEKLSIYDCVIMEGTGCGHLPVNEIDKYTKENSKILKSIEILNKNTKLVMTSQCLYGSVKMNVYNYGRRLQEVGVRGNHMNLTPESMFMRCAHILSKDKKNFDKLFQENLEGFEIRTVDQEFN